MMIKHLFIGICLLTAFQSDVFGQQPGGSPPHMSPKAGVPGVPSQAPKQPPKREFHPLPHRNLPAMDKPFGMPGVVGFKEGKWEGTDYLGHVANAMSVSVEIIKSESYEGPSLDEGAITNQIINLLKTGNISSHAEVKEGPPLPFLHLLLMIYPVDSDKILVYGSVRLFEAVQVMRKNFAPAGYWQGIMWESQDMILSSENQLNEQVKTLTDGLVNGFLSRYKLYNAVSDPALPPPPGKES